MRGVREVRGAVHGERELGADDGPDARSDGRPVKPRRAVYAVAIEQRQGGVAVPRRLID